MPPPSPPPSVTSADLISRGAISSGSNESSYSDTPRASSGAGGGIASITSDVFSTSGKDYNIGMGTEVGTGDLFHNVLGNAKIGLIDNEGVGSYLQNIKSNMNANMLDVMDRFALVGIERQFSTMVNGVGSIEFQKMSPGETFNAPRGVGTNTKQTGRH